MKFFAQRIFKMGGRLSPHVPIRMVVNCHIINLYFRYNTLYFNGYMNLCTWISMLEVIMMEQIVVKLDLKILCGVFSSLNVSQTLLSWLKFSTKKFYIAQNEETLFDDTSFYLQKYIFCLTKYSLRIDQY